MEETNLFGVESARASVGLYPPGRRSIPPHVYKAMETLLPEAIKVGHKGKLLELWSEPGPVARRSGWTVVADGSA